MQACSPGTTPPLAYATRGQVDTLTGWATRSRASPFPRPSPGGAPPPHAKPKTPPTPYEKAIGSHPPRHGRDQSVCTVARVHQRCARGVASHMRLWPLAAKRRRRRRQRRRPNAAWQRRAHVGSTFSTAGRRDRRRDRDSPRGPNHVEPWWVVLGTAREAGRWCPVSHYASQPTPLGWPGGRWYTG